ncbi:MAG: hypothetical protein ACM3XM_10475 [Mycobacterium leprae]
MDAEVLNTAQLLADRYLTELMDPGDLRILVKVAAVGYLAGSGVPTDEAVAAVERMAGQISHPTRNPLYHGLPWVVAGPVSGAPYYAGR